MKRTMKKPPARHNGHVGHNGQSWSAKFGGDGQRVKTEVGLVLQGGGALGAYELGVLERLYEEEGFEPAIVSGVSIGAINAAALVGGRGKPLEALKALWEEFTIPHLPLLPDQAEQMMALFGNMHFYKMRHDFFQMQSWTHYYDTTPLREALLRHVDFEKLQKAKTKLVITAVDVQTGEIIEFDNDEITVDHVIASGSLPPGFPMTKIHNRYYWDGGLFSNTPLSPVLKRFSRSEHTRKQLIVVNLFPKKGNVPTTMAEVEDRRIELNFCNKMMDDIQRMREVNKYLEVIKGLPKRIRDEIVEHDPSLDITKRQAIDDIIVIQNDDAESSTGHFDFSEKTLQRRYDSGYRDADIALKDLESKREAVQYVFSNSQFRPGSRNKPVGAHH